MDCSNVRLGFTLCNFLGSLDVSSPKKTMFKCFDCALVCPVLMALDVGTVYKKDCQVVLQTFCFGTPSGCYVVVADSRSVLAALSGSGVSGAVYLYPGEQCVCTELCKHGLWGQSDPVIDCVSPK